MYVVKDNEGTKESVFRALIFPFCFVATLWMIKIVEEHYGILLTTYGIYPRKISGIAGIVTGPLIHSSFTHLLNNSFPLLVLGTAIFYSYKSVRWKIFFWTYFITHLWVWAAARSSYHIGASGLVYGFASFVFFSGIIRKNIKLMALSLLVVFLYGSMVWGIFPIDYRISFETHLSGTVAGLLLAIYFRKEGPQRELYSWELEEADEPQTGSAYRDK